SSNALNLIPIEALKVDDFVLSLEHKQSKLMAFNNIFPYLEENSYDNIVINPESWQVGLFSSIDAANEIAIETNRPLSWYQENHLTKTGDFAHISIPELGISDIFILKDTRVTTIDSRKYSKKESAVDFNPIISTIRRKVKRLGKYKFDSGAEIICTLNHLFYSITRDSYIEIDQIERHEEILTSTGESAKLLSTNLIDTIAEVYNIEVWRDNNYYVGNQHSNEFL